MKVNSAWNLKKKSKENPQCGCTRKKPMLINQMIPLFKGCA